LVLRLTSDEDRRAACHRMVDEQIRARGIRHDVLLAAMREVPRHVFVPAAHQAMAYEDRPLSIGHGQTISQPYMVAAMTAALNPQASDCVLDVGTGSGYQAAVLARLAHEVVSVEWIPELATRARATFDALGVHNVRIVTGDGGLGFSGEKYEGILVSAGAPAVPPRLRDQLTDGGRLVIPVGTPIHQELVVVYRVGSRFHEVHGEACIFVPLRGAFGWGGLGTDDTIGS